jgi:hypothetical protein
MEFKQFNTYMHQPDAAYWQAALTTIPRKNLEKAIYDFSFANGVLSGLEIVQAVSPNLTVIVKAGRGVYRDPLTRKAKVIEVHADFTLDLTTHIPSGTASTIKIVASPSLNTTVEAAITVNNALITHPDYDAGFTPYNFDPLERDDALIEVDSTPTALQIVLGEVTLSAGQTQILSSHINLLTRDLGGFATAITKLQSDFANVSTNLVTHLESSTAHDAKNIFLDEIDGLTTGNVFEGVKNLRSQLVGLARLKHESALINFADSSGAVTTMTSSNFTLTEEFKDRTVMVTVGAVNVIFVGDTTQLSINIPGIGSIVLASHAPFGAFPNDQQTALSGSAIVTMPPTTSVGLSISATLTAVGGGGSLFDNKASSTRVTIHTID